jgi:hypothetical protein
MHAHTATLPSHPGWVYDSGTACTHTVLATRHILTGAGLALSLLLLPCLLPFVYLDDFFTWYPCSPPPQAQEALRDFYGQLRRQVPPGSGGGPITVRLSAEAGMLLLLSCTGCCAVRMLSSHVDIRNQLNQQQCVARRVVWLPC